MSTIWRRCALVESKYPGKEENYMKRYIQNLCKHENGETVFENIPADMARWVKRCQFKYHPCRTLKQHAWKSACISLAGEIESDRSAVSVGRRRKPIGKEALEQLQSQLGGELHTITTQSDAQTIEGHVLFIKGFLNEQQRRSTTFELQHIHGDFIDDKMWSHGKCKNKLARTNSNIGFMMQRGTVRRRIPRIARVPLCLTRACLRVQRFVIGSTGVW